jgi:ABC-type antimicrobial peptide transport system permease subunit
MLEYPRIVAQNFTSKQKWFADVAFSLVLVVVAVFIYTALASDDISNQPTQENKLYQAMISVLLALLGTLVVTLFAMVFDPIRKWLKRYSRADGGSSLRILLFGAPGSGKSALPTTS